MSQRQIAITGVLLREAAAKIGFLANIHLIGFALILNILMIAGIKVRMYIMAKVCIDCSSSL